MAYLNRVFLIGNLTRDVEIRATPRGTSVAAFGVATNRRFKDETGGAREEICFVDTEAWGKTAELCAKYLRKGDPVFLEGHLRLDSWEDKQSGQKRHKLKVVIDNVQFLKGAPEREPGSPPPEREKPSSDEPKATPPREKGPPKQVDDDVPF